jgi:hypothetical protein
VRGSRRNLQNWVPAPWFLKTLVFFGLRRSKFLPHSNHVNKSPDRLAILILHLVTTANLQNKLLIGFAEVCKASLLSPFHSLWTIRILAHEPVPNRSCAIDDYFPCFGCFMKSSYADRINIDGFWKDLRDEISPPIQ